MHLLQRIFNGLLLSGLTLTKSRFKRLWLKSLKPRGSKSQPSSNDLLHKCEVSSACARDLGVSVTRIRLPSGGEILLVEKMAEPEQDDAGPDAVR